MMSSDIVKRSIELSQIQQRQVTARVFGRPRTARAKRTLRIGSPESGKSFASEVEACEWWLTPYEKRGLLFIDPHGDSVQSLARRFVAAGRGKRVVLDELSAVSRVPAYKQFDLIDGEGFMAEVAIHDGVMRAVEMYADERGHMERVNLHPYVREWLYWALRAVFRCERPLRDVLKVYDVFSDESRRIVESSNDAATKKAFQDLLALPKAEIERQMGAARRIIKSSIVAHMRERSGDWDWCEFLNAGGALLIDGSGVAQETMRTFALSLVLRALIYGRTKRTPQLIIADEANRGLTTSHMVSDLIEQISKYLSGLTFCQQAPVYPKEIEKRFWQSWQRVELFRSSPEVLKDMLHHLWPLVDFHREHHRDVTWQQFHDGFEQMERDKQSHTVGKQHHGGEHPYDSETESRTSSTDIIVRPKYREFATERIAYMTTNDQLIEAAVNVMQQAPGERLVLENGRAFWDTVPWLDSPFPRAFERTYEKRFEEFLCEMRERPYFRTPQAEEEPIRLGAACRLQKLQAELNGHSNGSNGALRS